MQGISVIICCHNSAQKLPTTLSYLLNQDVPFNFDWEIIVINNNSTDSTKKVVNEILGNNSIPYKIVDENKPGLSNARKKGVYESKYDFLIFCDDDNWLYPDYLNRVFGIFNSKQNVGAIGGQGIAVFENNKEPDWFKYYEEAFACGKQGPSTGIVTMERNYLFGSGLAVRKQILNNIYDKKLLKLSDRKGKKITSGGDSEICIQISLHGFDLFYDEYLIYKHYIPLARTNWKYLEKLYYSFGASHYHLFPLQQNLIGINSKLKFYPFKRLIDFWKEDWKNVLFYLVTHKHFSGTVKGAWLWGLTKKYLCSIFKA